MDAISLLKHDHAEVKAMFSELEDLGHGSRAEKKELMERLIRELSIHAAVEEQIIYPFAKERDAKLEEIIEKSLEEHSVAKWELSALERREVGRDRFDGKLSVLIDSVRRHIQEEESVLFPRLRQICSDEELKELGERLLMAKRIAPTHPHPRAPDEPPGNTMVPVMAAMDRGRDLAAETLEWGRELVERSLERGRRVLRGQRQRLANLRRSARSLNRKAVKSTEQAAKRVRRQVQRTVDDATRQAMTTARKTRRAAKAAVTAVPRKVEAAQRSIINTSQKVADAPRRAQKTVRRATAARRAVATRRAHEAKRSAAARRAAATRKRGRSSSKRR